MKKNLSRVLVLAASIFVFNPALSEAQVSGLPILETSYYVQCVQSVLEQEPTTEDLALSICLQIYAYTLAVDELQSDEAFEPVGEAMHARESD